MTYSDDYNIRTTQVKFNDVADAIDGVLVRNAGGTTSGSSTSYIASPTPAWSEVVDGAFIIVTPHTANLANATLNVSDTGPVPILKGGVAVGAGQFLVGVPQLLLYQNGGWEIVAGGTLQPAVLLPLTLDTVNNRVGINETAPQTTLHLKQAAPVIRLQDTDGGYVDISADGGTGSLAIKADPANSLVNTSISFQIDGAERASISNGGQISSNNLVATTGGTTVVPLVGRGAAGQTANLLELKNSAGTNQFSVGPSGAVTGASSAAFSGAVSGTTGTFSGAVSGTTGTFNSGVTTGTLTGIYDPDSLEYLITSTSGLYLYGTGWLQSPQVDTSKVQGINGGALYLNSDLNNVFINANLYCDIESYTRDIRFYVAASRDVCFPSIVTGSGTTAVIEAGTNAIKKLSSSQRYKKDIEPIDPQYINNIFSLEPKWFRLTEPSRVYPESWGYFGLIAEEVAAVDPRLVVWGYLPEDLDENDEVKPGAQMVPEAVNYHVLGVLMIDIVKQLRAEVDELKAKVG